MKENAKEIKLNGSLEKSATEKFSQELLRKIRASYSAIFVHTYEETRTLKVIKEACVKCNREMWVWDIGLGVSNNPEALPKTSIKFYHGLPNPSTEDQKQVELDDASHLFPIFNSNSFKKRTVLVVLDFFFVLGEGLNANPSIIRSIKNVLNDMKEAGKTAIFVGPRLAIPEELEKDITEMMFPLPDRSEMVQILDYVVKCAEKSSPDKQIEMIDDIKERLCEAALGLTSQEAEDLFSLVLAKSYKLDESSVKTVLEGKQGIVKKDGLLEFVNTDVMPEDVGGYQLLKIWINKRIKSFTEEARDFGLPYPKGLLMAGVPGCGKSLIAKMIANLLGVPLLRLDMGRIYNKFQGQSENHSRRAIMVAEAVAPAELWIDEIEKGFAGLESSNETSGGVEARVIQTFLTWMQEKTSPVFLAATGNNVAKLPPELMRKGRFDEIFFLDLPNFEERKDIIKIHLRKRAYKTKNAKGETIMKTRDLPEEDVKKIAEASKGFTGAEIESAIIQALYDCFSDKKRELKANDVVAVFKTGIPLAKTMEMEIKALVQWSERAKPASAPEFGINDATHNPFRRIKTDDSE